MASSHLELFYLHLTAVVDDSDALYEHIRGGMGSESNLVAPSLADEKYAGACRGREHVVGDASVLLERGGGQFLGGGKSVIETAFNSRIRRLSTMTSAL